MELDKKELTLEVTKELNGQKVRIYATQQIDWFTKKIEGDIYKILYVDDRNAAYIMKPRATRRGINLLSLEQPVLYTKI